MTDEEYAQTQTGILMVASLIATLDITAFLERIEGAHALGPILDPTRYLAAYDNLTDIQRLARAALALKAETTRQTEKAALSAARTNP